MTRSAGIGQMLASAARAAHLGRMVKPSPLDDSTTARFARARFVRLMKLMAAITAITVVAILVYMRVTLIDVPIHFYIATGLGVSASMLLMGALMGLVFMSNGTGHDESVSRGPDQPD